MVGNERTESLPFDVEHTDVEAALLVRGIARVDVSRESTSAAMNGSPNSFSWTLLFRQHTVDLDTVQAVPDTTTVDLSMSVTDTVVSTAGGETTLLFTHDTTPEETVQIQANDRIYLEGFGTSDTPSGEDISGLNGAFLIVQASPAPTLTSFSAKYISGGTMISDNSYAMSTGTAKVRITYPFKGIGAGIHTRRPGASNSFVVGVPEVQTLTLRAPSSISTGA